MVTLDDRLRGGTRTHWEDPLQCKGNSPGPFVISLVEGVGSPADNDATNRPTHLQSTCAGTTKSQGNDLASIGGGVGNEESPGDTFERLPNHENFE